MSTFYITMAFGLLMGAAGIALYVAVFGTRRVFEERLADLAVKMRLSQADPEGKEDEGFGRLLLQWAVRHLPPPKTDTPTGEKMVQMLVQAGYIKSAAPQIFQVIRFGSAAVFMVIGLLMAVITAQPTTTAIAYAAAGVAIGFFAPSYYIGNRARAAKARSDGNSPTCSTCWWSASKRDSDCMRRSRWWEPRPNVTGR